MKTLFLLLIFPLPHFNDSRYSQAEVYSETSKTSKMALNKKKISADTIYSKMFHLRYSTGLRIRFCKAIAVVLYLTVSVSRSKIFICCCRVNNDF